MDNETALHIETTSERIIIRYQTKEGIRTIYNVHTSTLRYMGIAPERGIAHILSQDMDLLQLFVEDWKRLQKGGDSDAQH